MGYAISTILIIIKLRPRRLNFIKNFNLSCAKLQWIGNVVCIESRLIKKVKVRQNKTRKRWVSQKQLGNFYILTTARNSKDSYQLKKLHFLVQAWNFVSIF